MSDRIVLGSGSPFRRQLLENAGVAVEVVKPQTDERAVEAAIGDADVPPSDLAAILAEAKAMDVSERVPNAWTIGCDQVMSLEGRVFHKPADMEEARRNLLALSGRTHELHSAVVLARRGEAVWRHVSTALLTMRRLEPAFVGRYLAAAGEVALQSVGAYQIEGRGIQLLERIDGDHFTIVGLPLLPLLEELRRQGAIDG